VKQIVNKKPTDLKLIRMKRAVNALISDIRNQYFPVDKIIIFGSVLNDSFNEYSDLDICLVCDDELTEKQMRTIENYIQNMLCGEISADFIYCTHEKLEFGQQVFESIREKGKILYERA